jgi:hypothetical protein
LNWIKQYILFHDIKHPRLLSCFIISGRPVINMILSFSLASLTRNLSPQLQVLEPVSSLREIAG